MTITITCAGRQHVESLCALMKTVWEDIQADPGYISGIIGQPNRATCLAVDRGRVVGFADGFGTLSQDGIRRWELDLLGVHPEYRGRGIATKLVTQCTLFGKHSGATVGRCLIASGNTGSERAFAHSGYTADRESSWLFVSSHSDFSMMPEDASSSYLVPVQTLSYHGLWIEGELSHAGLVSGAMACAKRGLKIVGVVIPETNRAAVSAAERLGFTLIGQYRYWYCKLNQ